MRPRNRNITTNWENWLPKKLFKDHSHSGGEEAIAPTAPLPYGSATARNRGNVQVIVRKDHRMRLFFLREQLIRSSEQLVLVNTTKGVFRPCVDLSLTANSIKRKAVFGRPLGPGLCHRKSVRPSVCNVGGLWPNGLGDRDDFWHTPCPGQQ